MRTQDHGLPTADSGEMISLPRLVIDAFYRLLVDVSYLTGIPLGMPDERVASWILIEGPRLDKILLGALENSDRDWPSFPDWVKPLSEFFRIHRDPVSLGYLRNVLVFGYKAKLEPTNDQVQEAQASYLATEKANLDWSAWFNSHSVKPALFRSARQIVARIIYRIDWSQIIPSHGPGAVFPRRCPSEKTNWETCYPTIEEYYPWDTHFCPIPSYWESAGAYRTSNKTSKDILCSLVCVPKDSRGPRLISVHPAEAIWIQQGQRRLLEAAITSHPYTRSRIVFNDQTINGECARSSSASRELCSLDLKEASDRLTCSLVEFLFGGAYPWISCSRATSVRLFDGRIIKLEKWAPMGNCLIFPVQSLVFYATVRAGIRARYGVDCNDVYVFGDDILFPRQYYDGVVDALHLFGFMVNQGKSFQHGFFRESCGVDAYHGIKVTPHRIKEHDVSTVSGAVSVCSLAKRLTMDGYCETASFLYSQVSKYWPLHLCNDPDAQGIYEYVDRDLLFFMRYERSLRWNRSLHKWEVKILRAKPIIDRIARHDWYHVVDSLNRLYCPSDDNAESVLTDRHRWMGKTTSPMQSSTGLEYAIPYRTRPEYGWTGLL